MKSCNVSFDSQSINNKNKSYQNTLKEVTNVPSFGNVVLCVTAITTLSFLMNMFFSMFIVSSVLLPFIVAFSILAYFGFYMNYSKATKGRFSFSLFLIVLLLASLALSLSVFELIVVGSVVFWLLLVIFFEQRQLLSWIAAMYMALCLLLGLLTFILASNLFIAIAVWFLSIGLFRQFSRLFIVDAHADRNGWGRSTRPTKIAEGSSATSDFERSYQTAKSAIEQLYRS